MMKKLNLVLGIVLITSGWLSAQDVREDIEIEIQRSEYSSDSEVVIKNINGSLEVTGYEGDEIVVTGTKKLWKNRGNISNQEAEEYYLESVIRDGNVYIYVETPYSRVRWYNRRMEYSYNWNGRDRDRIDFEFDIEVKIPNNLYVDASTVNGGTLWITSMENGVDASNVNGSVVVKDVVGVVDAHTVNGDIEVWFKESPLEDCEFETVNGTMEVFSPGDFGAIVTFKSLHGELYTDFDKITRLANQLNKEEYRDGYRYRISRTAPIQIGDGGPKLSFESVNGSAYIRQRES